MNDRVAESAIDRRAARIRNCRIADGACTFLDESSRYAARLDADEGVEMTMVGLNREQRRTLADKLPDMANVAVGALVFGQFLGDRPFSPIAAIGGGVL
jgi:hypothetical protein